MEILKYALGCAFNLNDMFLNFPFKKLKFTCEDCKNINGNPHRDVLIKQIFRECFKIIIDDIIDNNITFNLPTSGKKSNIHMRKIRGNEFKNLRKSGKWRDVDFLESNFTGYEICLYIYRKTLPRIKTIYVDKKRKQKITDNTNKGIQYGDSNKDKYIKDYYELIKQKYPTISINDIKRILNFGWRSLYLINSYGGDLIISNSDIWSYIGFLKNNPLEHFKYYIKKLSLRIRVLYRRKKIPWNGYYYFALSKSQYNKLLEQQPKKGRRKKNLNYGCVNMYQILDECKIAESGREYIFRIPYITTVKFKFYIPELITDKAELILIREPLKFKDILTYYNDYEVI